MNGGCVSTITPSRPLASQKSASKTTIRTNTMAVATAAASTVATVAASTHPGRPRVLMTTPFLLPSLASTQLRTSPSKYQGTCVIAVTPTLQPKSLDRTTGVATVSENASNSRPTKKTPLVAPKSRPVSAPVVTPTTAKKVLLVPMSRPVTIPRSNGPVSQPVSKIVSVDVPLPNTGSAAFAPRSKTHVPLRKLPVVDVPPTSRRTSEAPMALIRTVAPKFLGAPKAMSPVSFVNPTSDDCIPSLRTVTSEKKASEKKTVDGINKKVSPLPKCSVKQRALALLKKHWGYTEFRAHQYEIISQALNGRDCMVVMATGSGKSICYQLPALLHGRPTIVVSPLISLMEDQCRSLHAAGISACHLSSSQTDSEVWHKARRGEYALIYMAPERIETWSEGLAALARDGGITSFAIDEAHSISEWGHDFRTSYRELGVHLRARFPRIPIVAFTATATERVQTDIVTNLRLRTPYVVRTGFDRPNLTYRVRALASTSAIFDALIRELNRTVASTSSPVDIINSDETVTDVKSDGEGEGGGGYSAGNVEIKDNGAASAESCVIYCMTKKKTTEVVAHLLSHGIRAAAYHAGLSSQTRSKVHRDYFKDNVRIIVATVAFGMGIDKPDIRRVIHLGVPKSIEAYYQQTGRAGRDGAPSDCLLLYAPRDFTIGSFLSGSSTNDAEMLAAMRAYLITDRCRRAVLLRYFDVGDDDATATAVANHDGADIPTNCANCDNCLAPAVALVDRFECTVEARHLACAVRETRERFGMAVPCAIVRGSTASKVSGKVRNVERLKSFGTLRHRSEKYVRALSQMLVNARVLEQFTRAKFSLYRVGDVGRRLLNDPRYTLPPLVPSSEMSAELRLLLRSRGTTHSSTAPVSRRVSATQECDSRVSVTQECDSTDAKSESKVSVVSEQSTASELVEWLCQQGVKPESDAKDEHAALWRQAHKQLTQVARQQKRDTDLERKLYVLLTILRKTEADMRGVAPYQILGALTLTALAKYKPTTIEAFRSIEGVSEAGHAFAERFTQAISTFAKTHGMCTDTVVECVPKTIASPQVVRKEKKLGSTALASVTAFQADRLSIGEIALRRGIRSSTVCEHLELALTSGIKLDWERLGICDEWTREIQEAIRVLSSSSGVVTLTAIKKAVREEIDFATIKLVRAKLQFDPTVACQPPVAPIPVAIVPKFPPPMEDRPAKSTLLLPDRCKEDERAEQERRARPPLLTRDQRKRKRQATTVGDDGDTKTGSVDANEADESSKDNSHQLPVTSASVVTVADTNRRVRPRAQIARVRPRAQIAPSLLPTTESVLEALGKHKDEPVSRDRLQQMLCPNSNGVVASALLKQLEEVLEHLQNEGAIWMPSPSAFTLLN